MRFLNFKNWENLLNIEHFFMTSLPVKMTSYQKTVWSINRFWVELSSTKIFWWFPYHNPHSKVKRAPYFPIFNSEKQRYRSQINEQVTVLNQVEYGEFDEHTSFWYFDVWYSYELKIFFINRNRTEVLNNYPVVTTSKALWILRRRL